MANEFWYRCIRRLEGRSCVVGTSPVTSQGFSGTTLDPIPVLFYDYFESGNMSKWSRSVP